MKKCREKKTTRSVFPYYRKDEIGVLASSFNNMLQYTHELIMSLNQTIEQLQDEKEKVRIQQLLETTGGAEGAAGADQPISSTIHWIPYAGRRRRSMRKISAR